MKIISGKEIPTRVLIKKLTQTIKTKAGLEIPPDNNALPMAEVVLVSEGAKGILAVKDKVYYIESREKGLCKYKGKEHFIIPIGQVVAIII